MTSTQDLKPARPLSDAAQFFFDHAGYSWNPTIGETKAEGATRCAENLAKAETDGRAAGLSFRWSIDDQSDSSEFSNETPSWSLWQCTCVDRENAALAYLGAIDFGRDGSPQRDPYARVVEAELAQEAAQ